MWVKTMVDNDNLEQRKSMHEPRRSVHCEAIPTPIEGEGGGDKTNLTNSTFFAWKPWNSDPIPRMEL